MSHRFEIVQNGITIAKVESDDRRDAIDEILIYVSMLSQDEAKLHISAGNDEDLKALFSVIREGKPTCH